MDEKPTFPMTNVNLTPEGVLFTIALGPGLSINYAVGEQMMNELCQKWLETRQEIKQQLHLIRKIQDSKNN